MRISDFILNDAQITNSTDGIVFVADVTDGYEYVDGKRAESPSFKKLTVSLPKRKLEQIVVKVMDMKLPLTTELLEQKGGSVKVKFKNLTGRFYFDRDSHEPKLSCKADGVEVLP